MIDYPIRTARLLLRPYRLSDADALHAFQSRADVTRYLYWEPRSLDEVRANIAMRINEHTLDEHNDNVSLVIVRADGGDAIGTANLSWSSREHRQGELGYVLHPDHQGRGYATEVAKALLRLGFEGAGMHRIVGRCDGRNLASARVMERAGMRREAYLRQNEFVKGEWTDEFVYAMLTAEWRSRN